VVVGVIGYPILFLAETDERDLTKLESKIGGSFKDGEI
jgi:hypothetical protein